MATSNFLHNPQLPSYNGKYTIRKGDKTLAARKNSLMSFGLAMVLALTVAACAPGSRKAQDLGETLRTKSEVTRYISGNFIPNGGGGGNYFADTGEFHYVEVQIDQIGGGKWRVSDGNPAKLCVEDHIVHDKLGNKISKTAQADYCFEISLRSDGSAVWIGGRHGEVIVEKPVPGFPLEARFNALRVAMGV